MNFLPKDKRSGIRLAVLLVLLGGFLTVRSIPGAPETFRKTIFSIIPPPKPHELFLKGTPYQRGLIHGKRMKWAIRLLDKTYIRYFSPEGKLAVHRKNAEEIFAYLKEEWRTEIAGLAEASGTDVDILMLGNSFLDMGLNASGCRQIHLKTSAGVLHSHNLDWDNLGGVGNYLVTIFRTDTPGRLRTVHLGFPGMIGVLDIINEKGIALSFNQLGLASSGSKGSPVFIRMREIAEECTDFEQAANALERMPPGMPFCIGLTSANGKMAVFEREISNGEIVRRDGENGIITADNSAYGKRPPKPDGMDCLIRSASISGEKELKKWLKHPKVLLGCNIYSLIFHFQGNCFYLASGEVPAACGTYRRYPLF